MAKVKRCFQVAYEFVNTCGCCHNNESLYTPVTLSNASDLFKSLIVCIDTNDIKNFNAILSGNFIYPNNNWEGNSYKKVYVGGNHRKEWCYEYYHTRPALETLFLEHHDLFLSLLSDLARSNNKDLHKIFVDTYKGNRELPQNLMTPCNKNLRLTLATGVQAIKNYGDQLCNAGINKGSHARALAASLGDDLYLMPLNDNTPSAIVKSLNFKFNFVKKLHSLDAVLGGHHGWKEIIMNIAISISTGFIANIFNLAFNQTFFFSCNTKTQDLVGNVSKKFEAEKQVMNMR